MNRPPKMLISTALLATTLTVISGCISKPEEEVVVYCALDREFSEPILDQFESQTGIVPSVKYDIESTKTVGLVTAIINEKSRPRCDLFWNNEILHTLRLKEKGLLDVYLSPAAQNFPQSYVSADHDWTGFAARARVLIVNTDLLPAPDNWPRSVHELANPKWKGRAAMAKPLFGSTATHAAVLFEQLGEKKAKQFFTDVSKVTDILAGNKHVALAVGSGQYAFGITDTDDAIIEIENGKPIKIVFPDQDQGECGTLFIPNSLCLIKGAPNKKNAKRLIDYLLSKEVESQLAQGASAQFPVNTDVQIKSRVDNGQKAIRWMEVDFEAAASKWDTAVDFLSQTFQK